MKNLTEQIQCYQHAWQSSPSPAAILPPESAGEMGRIRQRIQVIIAYIEVRGATAGDDRKMNNEPLELEQIGNTGTLTELSPHRFKDFWR
jgi:hypothetical protein